MTRAQAKRFAKAAVSWGWYGVNITMADDLGDPKAGFACQGHTAEQAQWMRMSEAERALWERQQ